MNSPRGDLSELTKLGTVGEPAQDGLLNEHVGCVLWRKGGGLPSGMGGLREPAGSGSVDERRGRSGRSLPIFIVTVEQVDRLGVLAMCVRDALADVLGVILLDLGNRFFDEL